MLGPGQEATPPRCRADAQVRDVLGVGGETLLPLVRVLAEGHLVGDLKQPLSIARLGLPLLPEKHTAEQAGARAAKCTADDLSHDAALWKRRCVELQKEQVGLG